MAELKLRDVCFLVPRHDGLQVETVAVVRASTALSDSEFLPALKAALTEWFETEYGRGAWERSSQDFNVGDLSLVLEEDQRELHECLLRHGIQELSVDAYDSSSAVDWSFDEVLRT